MPIPPSYEKAFEYLKQHKNEALKDVVAEAEQDKALDDLQARMALFYARNPEDLRAAVTMAVDAAKALVAIGIAFFVAVGGFLVQYVTTHGAVLTSITFICLVAAGVCAFVSMVAGFFAIGIAFKNAQGLAPATLTTQTWSTEPMKKTLNIQSLIGALGIIFFAGALVFWAGANVGGFGATVVPAAAPVPTSGYKLRFEGSWSSLVVRRGDLSFTPPVPAAGQTAAFDVELK